MAQEQKRGCGYRRVGGMYLVGKYIGVSCDRLPLPIGKCPICGEGLKFPRQPREFNPLKFLGIHENCTDEHRPCSVCDPTSEPAYLFGVGREYTPQEFITEGLTMGFSKRIHQIPRNLKLGKTVVYLCHNQAYEIPDESAEETNKNNPKLVETPKMKKALGIFTAFIPQRIEKLYWQSALDDMPAKEKAKLKKRGITPVGIKDGDKDHR